MCETTMLVSEEDVEARALRNAGGTVVSSSRARGLVLQIILDGHDGFVGCVTVHGGAGSSIEAGIDGKSGRIMMKSQRLSLSVVGVGSFFGRRTAPMGEEPMANPWVAG
jgi:hypothetical protein